MIRDRGVANRYANALFGAAESRGASEAVLADLESLAELEEKGTASLQNFLESPSVVEKRKEEVVDKVLKGKADPLTVHLVDLMLRKKRIQHLPLVLAPFRRLVEAKLGTERAEVQSAVPLDASQIERLRAGLARVTGKKIKIVTEINPAILGGVVVTVGGQILDSSLRTRLATMREQLLATRVVGR